MNKCVFCSELATEWPDEYFCDKDRQETGAKIIYESESIKEDTFLCEYHMSMAIPDSLESVKVENDKTGYVFNSDYFHPFQDEDFKRRFDKLVEQLTQFSFAHDLRGKYFRDEYASGNYKLSGEGEKEFFYQYRNDIPRFGLVEHELIMFRPGYRYYPKFGLECEFNKLGEPLIELLIDIEGQAFFNKFLDYAYECVLSESKLNKQLSNHLSVLAKAKKDKGRSPVRCAAIKQDGKRCTQFAKDGHDLCGFHLKGQWSMLDKTRLDDEIRLNKAIDLLRGKLDIKKLED